MLANQEDAYKQLEENISPLTGIKIISLSGKSGIGKSFLIQKLVEEIKEKYACPICYIKGDQFCQGREYFCIKKALTQLTLPYEQIQNTKDFATDLFKDIPYFGTVGSRVISNKLHKQEIEQKNSGYFLNEEELEIVFRLNYLFDKKYSLVICDNLQYFDLKSLELLYLLITSDQYWNTFFSKCQILFVYTEMDEKRESIIKKIYSTCASNHIKMSDVHYEDIDKILKNFGCKIDLAEEIKRVLFKLSDGHLEIIKHIASQMTSNQSKSKITVKENNAEKFLEELINNKLKDLGASGKQIAELLEYASLIGKTFSNDELSRIVELNKQDFYDAIKKSNEMELISSQEKYSIFSHDIIQLLFHKRADQRYIHYYERMKKCIKELYPSEYERRIEIEQKLCDYSAASILIALLAAKKNYDLVFEEENYLILLSFQPYIKEFLQDMQDAYTEYLAANYKKTLSILNSIDDLLPIELLAERDLLKAITLTKILNEQSRQRAISCIQEYTLEKLNNEGDLYLRVQLTLISSYAHMAQIDKAKECEKNIMAYLQPRLNYDENAQYIANVLRRKSNAMHECIYAERNIRKSVQYFAPLQGQNAPLNPIQYLMSLGNYAGILIECGQFLDCFNAITKAQRLVEDNPQMTFPRIHILDNNYLLCIYLMDGERKKEVLDSYKYLTKYNENADHIFIISNYSALLSVNGFVDDAYKLLEEQYLKKQKNKEPFYEICLTNNLMVLKLFKKDFSGAQELLDILMNSIEGIIDESYYRKKYKLFQQIIYDKSDIPLEKIDTFLFDYCENFQEAWAYWGRSFDYVALYYWSDK